MAVAFVAAMAHGGNGTSWTTALDAGSVAGRLILASPVATAGSITSVTYAGAGLTETGETNYNNAIWVLNGAASGSNNLVTSQSSYTWTNNVASSYSGVDATTPLGSLVSNSGTVSGGGSINTGSITCPANGMTYGTATHGYLSGGQAMTTTTGTTIWSGAGSAGWVVGSYHNATAAITWTAPGGGSCSWWSSAYPINPAAADAMPPRPITILDAVHRASNW